ncbi:MAG: 3-hydroxyacyl-ACP dehydratase FabZ [Zoogloeaceae bacterium]|nr:3-hydroxyacyl-ACP dehydratase FabZ [Zoogloeaceae bacterium]
MDIHQIIEHLPHRYPFLLIDRVVALEPGQSIHAYKNVTINEPFFVGHFPHHPVMPGVLIMEALAQAAGILSFRTMGTKPTDDAVFYFVGIDGARFKKPVMPGDQLHLFVEIERQMRGVWKYKATARVGDDVVAEANLMCAQRELP